MFQYATERAERSQRGFEASIITAYLGSVSRSVYVGQGSPARAGRVRDYWVATWVRPRVALFIPWINPGQSEVNPISLNEKSGDHLKSCALQGCTPSPLLVRRVLASIGATDREPSRA
jgi:hypothetical protein